METTLHQMTAHQALSENREPANLPIRIPGYRETRKSAVRVAWWLFLATESLFAAPESLARTECENEPPSSLSKNLILVGKGSL